MQKTKTKLVAVFMAMVFTVTAMLASSATSEENVKVVNAETTASTEYGSLEISGGGFVSGIITGQNVMYARTDVGGAYRYDYDTERWVQMLNFVSEEDRGFLSVDAMAIDPTDDNTIYLLCGCAYFSEARTVVMKSTDGGITFTESDVTDLIQVHGNGVGRQCGEAIAVDPDNPNTIYCGGDTTGLIVSNDGGQTWELVDSYNNLGLFTETIKWPTWTDHTVKATSTEYSSSNGVATIAIEDGIVYIGASVKGVTNMYKAEVGGDEWTPVHDELPTDLYPSRITKDADNNLLISYIPGLAFASGGGGAYRYNVKTGELTDITPAANTPIGSVTSAKDDPNKLVATTCGLWYSQLWDKDDWNNDKVAWGDITFKSLDGGKTWTRMAPGNESYWGGPLQADYLQDGGVDWVRNKAIHWTGNLIIDPRDSNKVFMTSGNGVFACDNIWDELPSFYFHAKGIEEVVALDLVSVPGGDVYSAIGDYDGFIHKGVNQPSIQHQPNMGSTNAIAYCPSNPDVMVRYAENEAKGYYTMDGGENWISMKVQQGGQKAAITQLEDGTYRFFCGKNYSDDFGETWNAVTGISSNSTVHIKVDPENPQYVYSAGNDNNAYDPTSKPNNYLFVSSDYGKTFTKTTICAYDKAEDYGRITAAGNGTVYAPCGYYGLYVTNDYGKTTTKLENVDTCFAVGVGAAKDENSPLAVYIWGEANGTGITGIYRSNDAGKTWERINDDQHQFGGIGNGKFIIGDMNTYGTFYMSTVGIGIVYGQLASGDDNPDPTETSVTTTATTPSETTTSTSTDISERLWGDANCDGKITTADLVLLSKYLVSMGEISEEGMLNIDVKNDGKLSSSDLVMLSKYLVSAITYEELGKA